MYRLGLLAVAATALGCGGRASHQSEEDSAATTGSESSTNGTSSESTTTTGSDEETTGDDGTMFVPKGDNQVDTGGPLECDGLSVLEVGDDALSLGVELLDDLDNEGVQALIVGDFDGDGNDDLATASPRRVYWGPLQPGMAYEFPAGGVARPLAAGDFDEDGDAELVRLGDDTFEVVDFVNREAQTDVLEAADISSLVASVGDLDLDGHLDLLAAWNTGGPLAAAWVQYGDGTGGFSDPEYFGMGMIPDKVSAYSIEAIGVVPGGAEVWTVHSVGGYEGDQMPRPWIWTHLVDIPGDPAGMIDFPIADVWQPVITDLDLDTVPDLLVRDGPQWWTYSGNTMKLVADFDEGGPGAPVVIDYDLDGHPDIAALDGLLVMGTPDGPGMNIRALPPDAISDGAAIAYGDFDGSGTPRLVLAYRRPCD